VERAKRKIDRLLERPYLDRVEFVLILTSSLSN